MDADSQQLLQTLMSIANEWPVYRGKIDELETHLSDHRDIEAAVVQVLMNASQATDHEKLLLLFMHELDRIENDPYYVRVRPHLNHAISRLRNIFETQMPAPPRKPGWIRRLVEWLW